MKKTITLIAAFLMLTAISFAQPGKSKKPITETEVKSVHADSILIVPGFYKTDTVKITAYFHVEENGTRYISFEDGFAIVKTFTQKAGQVDPVGQPRYVDKRYQPFRQRLKEVQPYNWK